MAGPVTKHPRGLQDTRTSTGVGDKVPTSAFARKRRAHEGAHRTYYSSLTSGCHNFGWWMDWLDAHSLCRHTPVCQVRCESDQTQE
jgi:hypothetical protein